MKLNEYLYKNIVVLIVLLFFGSTSLFAQNKLVDSLEGLYERSDLESSSKLIDQLEASYKKKAMWDSLAIILMYKAKVASKSGLFKEAPEINQEAVELARKHFQDSSYVFRQVFLQQVTFYRARGNINKSTQLADSLESIHKMYGINDDVRVKLLGDIGFNEFYKRNYESAINYAYKGAEILRSLPIQDSVNAINIFRVLGLSYEHLSQLDSTFKYKNIVYNVFKNNLPKAAVNVGIAAMDLGSAFMEANDMKRALELYSTTEEIFYNDFLKNGNRRYLAVVISNIGYLYYRIGEFELSKNYLEKALQLAIDEYGEKNTFLFGHHRKLLSNAILRSDTVQVDRQYNRLMDLYSTNKSSNPELEGQFDLAQMEYLSFQENWEVYIPRAKLLFNQYENSEGLFTKRCRGFSYNISHAYSEHGEYDEAIKWGKLNLVITDSIYHVLSEDKIENYTNYYNILHNADEIDQADSVFRLILKFRNNGNLPLSIENCIPSNELLTTFSTYFKNLAVDAETKNDFTEYLKEVDRFKVYYDRHLSIIRASSKLISNSEVLREIFAPAIFATYQTDPELAINHIEYYKSTYLRLNLQSNLLGNKSILTDLQQKRKEAEARYITDSDIASLNQLIKIDNKIISLRDSLNKFDPAGYLDYFRYEVIDLDKLRDGMASDELVLSFFHHGQKLLVFNIDKSGVGTAVIEDEEFKPHIRSLGVLSDSDRAGLYSLIINGKLKNHHDKLLIIPDDFLFYINFEELMEGSSYLIEKAVVHYANSLSVHELQGKRIYTSSKKFNYSILGLTPGFMDSTAVPSSGLLAGTGQERESNFLLKQPFLLKLSEFIGDNFADATMLSGGLASESNFYGRAGTSDIIHLATHSFIDDASPLFSKLILMNDSINDGALHAYEIFANKIAGRLAVLSSCKSGYGENRTGEGLASLAYSFAYAGVPTIVLTNRDTDEQTTAEILQYFYENIEKGQSVATALREAKLAFIRNHPHDELSNPFYWSGLQVYGADTTIYRTSLVWKYFLICVFAGTLIYAIRYFIRRGHQRFFS